MTMWPKSCVHDSNICSENKATCGSLCAEYDQILGQPKTERKFGVGTTVSQAWCSTITAATNADRDEGQHAIEQIEFTKSPQHSAGQSGADFCLESASFCACLSKVR